METDQRAHPPLTVRGHQPSGGGVVGSSLNLVSALMNGIHLLDVVKHAFLDRELQNTISNCSHFTMEFFLLPTPHPPLPTVHWGL